MKESGGEDLGLPLGLKRARLHPEQKEEEALKNEVEQPRGGAFRVC